MKDYYIEGADGCSNATEGRTRISELEMLYKAFRLGKRKNFHQDCKALKWKVLNFFLHRPFKRHLKLICLAKLK